jgi:hypothetical protein
VAKINKLGIFSFAKFQAILFALLGLVAGIIYSIGGFFIDVFVSLGWLSAITFETPGLSYGTLLAMGALIGMPVIFAAFGFIAGIIEALLYNLFATRFDGINFNIE